MKILFIINRLGRGGAQRLLLDICHVLSGYNNIEYKIIGFESLNEFPDYKESEKYIISKSKVKLSIFRNNEIDVVDLQNIIEQFKPDIIHSHLFKAELISRSCYYPSAKWFTHCHDNMIQFRNFRFKTFFNKVSFANYIEKRYLFKCYKQNGGTQFVAISNDTLGYFKKTTSSYLVHLLFNAIDVKRFKRRQTTELPKELKLVTIGSLVDNKNQQFLIKVVNILKDKESKVHLDILGDGINFKQLRNQIVSLQLDHYITLHGNINQVEEYLWQNSIYVHSAKKEAFGLTHIEAMAAGLPVVCLDGKGNRTIIEQGKNGFMVYEQNPELFAAKILEIWHNKELYHSMSTFAVEYAKQYDIKEYTDKLLQLYQEPLTE